MEEPWGKICMKWVELLKLTPSSDIISLTDGKFFLGFMKQYLHLDRDCYTVSETFGAVDTTLRNEFSSPDLVNLSDAQEGNEEELVKTITLFMYLAVVKYEHFGPKNYLDDAQFSEEAKFRMKCILKALLEQHGVVTPSLLTEIITSKVSSSFGHLSSGNVNKYRSLSSRSVGSPVIFTSSPSQESPLKEFLDSPTVRQVTKYQRLVKERDSQVRELRSQLEAEKMEKQLTMDELEQSRQAKESAETEVLAMKLEIRKRSAASDPDISEDDSNTELADKFHSLLKEKKDSDKYLALVEKQLEEREGVKEEMQTRLDALAGKLNAAQEDKREADLALVEMQTNLGSLNVENGKLQEVIQILRQELDDLNQQVLNKSLPNKATTTVGSFHLETMDMGNVSVDADESGYIPSIDGASVAGENMMDVVERRLEEKIERLAMELGAEKEAKACDREEANVRVTELEVELKEKKKQVDAYKECMEQLEERLDLERVEKKRLKQEIEVMYVDKQVISARLEETRMDLKKRVGDNMRTIVELKNSREDKLLLEGKVKAMEKDASVLKTQLAKEIKAKEVLMDSFDAQKQNLDKKQNEIESLIEDLSSASSKLREAKEKESNIMASLEAQSRCNDELSVENKRLFEGRHIMDAEFKHLNEENSELKLKLDRLTKELSSRNEDNHGNINYLQSELENKKRELWWSQLKSANLEKSISDQDMKTALKNQKERYQKRHQEVLTEVMGKNVQKMEELRNMCIDKNESLELEIKKLKKENEIVVAKYEDSKQKMTSMMENVATVEASSKEKLIVIQQKLNDAKDKIREFKKENDHIIVQLNVTKEKNKDLARIIEASKTRKPCDFERQLSKGNAVSNSDLSSRKASLPDFKGEDDVFQPTSVSGGRTASDGQVPPALKARPPSGSGSLFHCDEEEGQMFSSSNLMDVPGANKLVSSLTGAKVDGCEGDAEGRISEFSRRNSMYLPHLKSSYPVESQFLQEKLGTEDEIRQSNVKPQQPANVPDIKDISHQDSYVVNVGGQSTSKHPGRAKRISEEYKEGFVREDVPRMSMTRFQGQSVKRTTNKASPCKPEPLLQIKPKMPDLHSPRLDKCEKRKYQEKELKIPSQDNDSRGKRRKRFWGKTKEREGEPLLHDA